MTEEKTDPISLACENRSSRHAQLTCGQRYIWRVIRDLRAVETLNIPVTVDVTVPHDVEAIKSKVAWLVERYEALRTSFPIGDDGDPRQVLQCGGTIPVTIVDCEQGGVSTSTESLIGVLERTHFDLALDLPVRCGIVTLEGRPKTVTLVFSHMVTDGWSTSIIHEDFSKALNGDPDGAAWPPVWSPFDQADWEESTEGKQVLDAALEHWRTTIDLFPRATFYRALNHGAARLWRGAELHSPAMGIAAQFIAERNNVSTATVLLASFAMILSHLVRAKSFCTAILYCNRTTQEVERAVGSYPQSTPVVVDLNSTDFSAILTDVHFTLMDAYMNAQAWPPSVDAAIINSGAGKGVKIDIDTYFNISHDATLDKSQNEHIKDIDQSISKEINNSTISYEDPREFDIHTFSIKSYSSSTVFMLVDTDYIEAGNIDPIFDSLEKLIISMALEPDKDPWSCLAESGIAGYEPSSEWRNVGGSWLNLQAVNSYFLGNENISHCSVYPSEDGEQLVAYYVLRDGAHDLDEFLDSGHTNLLLDRSTMIPGEFVQCEYAPAGDRDQETAWRMAPVVGRRTRRTARHLAM